MKKVMYGVVCIATLATPALAQPRTTADSAEGTVSEVIVTSRKREERLQDIPAAGSAIGAGRIEEAGGLSDLRGLTALLPGVSMVDNGNVNSEFSIRGAGQAGRGINADAAIALLRNGAQVTGGNIGGRGFARLDMFDIERLEVLRGAQGSLYGANAVGGVISIISNAPKPRLEFIAEGGYNFTREGIDLIGIVNIPLSDKLALRAGFDVTEQYGGQVFNTVLREHIDYENYRGGRISLGFTPTDSIEVIATVDASHINDSPGPQIDVQQRRYDAIPETYDHRTTTEGNTEGRLKQDVFNAALTVEVDLGFAEFTSVTNYRARDSFATVDDDGRFPGAPLLRNGQPNIAGGAACRNNNCSSTFADDAKTFFHEFRLSGDAERLDWQVGVDYRALEDTYTTGVFGRINGVTPVPANFIVVLSENKTYGAFATGSFALTPTVTVEASGRFTQDEKDFEGGVANGAPQFGSIPPRSRTFVNWTYGGSIGWRPMESMNVYGRIATGFRAGGFNRDFGTSVALPGFPATPLAYGEELTTAYEIGLKYIWSPAARLSAAAFLTDYKDVLISDTGIRAAAQGGGNFFYLANLGDATAKGFEVELNGDLLNISATGGRLSYTIAATYVTSKVTSPITTVDGNQLPGTPDIALTVNGTYTQPIRQGLNGFLNVTFLGEDGGEFNITNTIHRDTNRSLALRAGLRSARGWELALRISNVLNQSYDYFQQAGLVGETPKREYLLQARYRY